MQVTDNDVVTVFNLKDIPRDGTVLVFGAGDGGVMIRRKLERFYGFRIAGFVDSYKVGEADGVAVIGINALFDKYPKDTPIVISSQAHAEIARILRDAGFTRIYNAFPYVINYVGDLRYEPQVRLTPDILERLRLDGVAGSEELVPGTMLDETTLRRLFHAASWPARVALIDFLIGATLPGSVDEIRLAAAVDVHRAFLVQLLGDLGNDACENAEAAALLALSKSVGNWDRASSWLACCDDHAARLRAVLVLHPRLDQAFSLAGLTAKLFSARSQGMEPTASFHERSYRLHRESMEELTDDPERELIHRSWFDEGTADYQMHERCYMAVDALRETGKESWLTIGDGRFGLDAVHLKRRGFHDVLATDISDALLKQAERFGCRIDYKVENAESLSFSDDSFDYVLCKESYHHFPRPMLALYEMIRVARRGVVLIEPQDPLIDAPILVEHTGRPQYETSGNYKYTLSRRELEKVALGLDFPMVAFRGLNTAYIRGEEFAPTSVVSPIYVELLASIREHDLACKAGRAKPMLLLAIVFKTEPSPVVRQSLEDQGWDVQPLTRNPFARVLR